MADDDSDDRFLFSAALKLVDPSIHCLMVGNGKEVLTMLQNDFFSLPDCIILDLNMPMMNGLECLQAIKKEPAYQAVPVILYSTTLEKETEQQMKQAGAYACFVKPSGTAELAAALRKLLIV
ncbi:MAG TPA: response regulator [Chitinophagaceae bacterium]|nr:response regulator [Chitinophagaceae bacterium]